MVPTKSWLHGTFIAPSKCTLQVPIQRIARYPLLCEAIWKRTPDATQHSVEADEKRGLDRAAAQLRKIADNCNTKLRELDDYKQLEHVVRQVMSHETTRAHMVLAKTHRRTDSHVLPYTLLRAALRRAGWTSGGLSITSQSSNTAGSSSSKVGNGQTLCIR